MSIRNVLETASGLALVLGFVVCMPFTAAHAGSHTWDINEVFSDSTGNIQFIELIEANGTPNETGVIGRTMSSTTKNFVIAGAVIVSPTSNKKFLLGTAAFAALPGAPAIDALIPIGVLPFFFNVAGDTLMYQPWDTLINGAVPTDGVTSLNRNQTTGVNSPTNYAGTTGSVNASPSSIPAFSAWGFVAVLVLLSGVGMRFAIGRRVTAS